MKLNIVIIGVNNLTQSIIEMIELENKFAIVALIDIEQLMTPQTINPKYPVFDAISNTTLFNKSHDLKFGAICIMDSALKKNIIEKIIGIYKDFQFINVTHPSAIFGKNVALGMGNIIGPKVIMNSDSKLGDFCIIEDSVSIGHDSSIGDFVTIDRNATLGGNTIIEDSCYIGKDCNIINDITIGKNCKIKDNSLILNNLNTNTTL